MRAKSTYRGARRAAAKAEAKRQGQPLWALWIQFAMLTGKARQWRAPPPPSGKVYRNKGVQETARRVRQAEARAHG